MHRLIVALLAAFDALVTGAVSIGAVLAPVVLLWAVSLGGTGWLLPWDVTAAVWQFGHLVPLHLHLPAQYLTAAGIPAQASSFTLSLAPLALTALTAILGARSGARAGRSGAWLTGVATGTIVFAGVAVLVGVSARTPVAAIHLWQAVLFPTLVFAVPAAAAAIGTAWHDDTGILSRLRESIAGLSGEWAHVPALVLRGAAAALAGLLGLGALAVAVALVVRGDEVVALYQAANLDVVGVVVVSLAQLAYLPTLVVWGIAFLAGPGFAVGAGTAVSPAGTQLGVVPGVPILGLLPPSVSPWLLALVLLPIGAGLLAGWTVRSRMAGIGGAAARTVTTVGVAAATAAGAALLSTIASGALGPDRLAQVGPSPGAVALAVGLEVLLGTGILLLGTSTPAPDGEPIGDVEQIAAPFAAPTADDTDTAPVDLGFFGLTSGDRP